MSFCIFFFRAVVVAIAVAVIAVSLFVVAVVVALKLLNFACTFLVLLFDHSHKFFGTDSVACSFYLVGFAILRSLFSSPQQFLEFH